MIAEKANLARQSSLNELFFLIWYQPYDSGLTKRITTFIINHFSYFTLKFMPPRLLVADDSADVRMGVKEIVRFELPSGIEIVEASDGREAIEAIRKAQALQFDAVVTDLNMPFHDGIEVANEAFDANVRNVILYTARDLMHLVRIYGADTMVELKKRGLKLLRKPSDIDEFIGAVVDPLRRPSD